MPSLKDLRNRINSVKSTQKITAAMKMVAAAKLRRAQEHALAARPYAERMERMLGSLARAMSSQPGAPRLLAGTGKSDAQLIVVMTSDRGLCGGFNSTIVRESRRLIRAHIADGRQVKLLCIGRKGRDQLRRDYGKLIVGTMEDVGRRRLAFSNAQAIAERIRAMFEAGEFDVATLVYNRFKSAMSQIITVQQVVPFAPGEVSGQADTGLGKAIYEYEPGEDAILGELLPLNMSVQIFRGLLENAASEEGARMTAMDSATRNAGEMIAKLTLNYNRTRQAYITKELIEIISGAEAL
jgi:F-type H+-transporting ATPase subunit gamma